MIFLVGKYLPPTILHAQWLFSSAGVCFDCFVQGITAVALYRPSAQPINTPSLIVIDGIAPGGEGGCGTILACSVADGSQQRQSMLKLPLLGNLITGSTVAIPGHMLTFFREWALPQRVAGSSRVVQGGLAGVLLVQVKAGTLTSEQQRQAVQQLQADVERARRVLQSRGITAAEALQLVPDAHCKLLSWQHGLKG